MRHLKTGHFDSGEPFFTAYSSAHWPSVFNASGRGDARFSPLVDTTDKVVPTLYGARTRTVALLETAFHEVHSGGARLISEATDLAHRGMVRLRMPERAPLVDLRDPALSQLALTRDQLVATLPLHYRCTREWAHALHARGHVGGALPAGIVWNSRIAEIAQADSILFDDILEGVPSEVFVLFGDRIATDSAAFAPSDRQENLGANEARSLVESIAAQLRATIV
jgi:hypothetical protein